MSFKKEWAKYGARVLTRNGPGKFHSFTGAGAQVELDSPWAGDKLLLGEVDEMVVESDFTLVRIINLGTFTPGLITNAQNYPSWDECKNALEEPVASNETLIALNFEKRQFKSNRKIESDDPYHILEIPLNVYRVLKVKLYSSLEEAQKAWQDDIDALSGTSDDILLCALLDFENKQILAKAVLAATQVVSKEIFWQD